VKAKILTILFALISFSAFAAEEQESAPPSQMLNSSGLPIPRFVSFKSEDVNMRVGPGMNYPIKWMYKRQNLPVEVVAEFGNWRKIRDYDGEEGWIMQVLLSGRRYAIVTSEAVVHNVYKGERAVARLSPGVQVQVEKCRATQCEIEHSQAHGWVEKNKLWGVYRNEEFD